MRLYEKLTFKEDDSLILRGKSFYKRQIRIREKFLKVSVLLKGTTSLRMSTFLNGSINVSQAILGANESGLKCCQHFMKVVINKYNLSFIPNQYQLL